ncbi:MAG: glycerol-3-phosphate 1-O-acyltransferase PlsY [Opitutaceae bacterium]|nr:glycerol-3-phosphate 1-O-acyltransferase PlsY [Opitutaceae bacterium]
MTYAPFAAAAIVGYLLGALPFGVMVARWHGVDIFRVGSGNPGATNVKRSVGKGAGNLVFALDFLKGVIAALQAGLWARLLPADAAHGAWLGLIGLTAAILGHSYSCFIRFRGGKGVATTLGGAIALMPVAALISVVVWLVLFYSTKYVSLASIGLAVTLPVAVFFLSGVSELFGFAVLLAVFVIVRHRENIVRLIRGTENRFVKKPAGASIETPAPGNQKS